MIWSNYFEHIAQHHGISPEQSCAPLTMAAEQADAGILPTAENLPRVCVWAPSDAVWVQQTGKQHRFALSASHAHTVRENESYVYVFPYIYIPFTLGLRAPVIRNSLARWITQQQQHNKHAAKWFVVLLALSLCFREFISRGQQWPSIHSASALYLHSVCAHLPSKESVLASTWVVDPGDG